MISKYPKYLYLLVLIINQSFNNLNAQVFRYYEEVVFTNDHFRQEGRGEDAIRVPYIAYSIRENIDIADSVFLLSFCKLTTCVNGIKITMNTCYSDIDTSIGLFKNLTKIDMRSCRYDREILRLPPSISELRKLKTAILGFRCNEESLPDSFANLDSLKTLTLGCLIENARIPEPIYRLKNIESIGLGFSSRITKDEFDDLVRLSLINTLKCITTPKSEIGWFKRTKLKYKYIKQGKKVYFTNLRK